MFVFIQNNMHILWNMSLHIIMYVLGKQHIISYFIKKKKKNKSWLTNNRILFAQITIIDVFLVYYLSKLKNKRKFFIAFIHIMQCIVFTTFIIYLYLSIWYNNYIIKWNLFIYTSTYCQYNTDQELFYVFFCKRSIDISVERKRSLFVLLSSLLFACPI